MPEDPNTLFEEAKCFRCNSDASLSDLLKLALLQRIAEAGDGGGGTPGGAASSVQFNDAGAFGGFGSFNSGTSVLTIPGDLLFNTDNADDIGASGASRPRTGYFGTSVVTPLLTVPAAANANAVAVTGYSLTGANAQSMLSLAGTWNTTGAPTALRMAITNTASNANSKFLEFLAGPAGATSLMSVSISGSTTTQTSLVIGSDSSVFAGGLLRLGTDTNLTRDAANVFGQRNGVTAQAFRVYRTFTDASNYERIALQSAANEMIVAAETAGTGGDNIDLGLTAAGTGRVKINTALNTAVDGGLTAAFTANMVGSTGGPTTAAQNGWQEFKDSTGANIWVPVWK